MRSWEKVADMHALEVKTEVHELNWIFTGKFDEIKKRDLELLNNFPFKFGENKARLQKAV